MTLAEHTGAKESASNYQVELGLWEAAMGQQTQARTEAQAALHLAPNNDAKAIAALALAWSGDTVAAEKIAGN